MDGFLEDPLANPIAQTVGDPVFRTQSLDRPKQALASIEI
ncbi:hypothetical protein Cha6605_3571 [Chamaesiphon minutus PCC 6605]|uniref:Uncharacterized protein n=1 Tax=Chamaesiphon minutus (strain ATCC 27169 / PCC 6605) TaxID=1173020 RepID=K9UIB9_CHAP6|nr:hypothetical protein Cha6605_3571 [Chamaesiphon minutus PCC 6605]